MAKLFLSYVREDQERARALAQLLEGAGHSVWWDRHIKGGAEFALEIEAALNSADKVVVLWSARSVRSPWVRDEAAAGRDSGRLIPVCLDGSEAPLGFRQYQGVDLSEWKSRRRPRQWDALLAAVDAERAIEAAFTPSRRVRPRVPVWAVAAAALLVAGIAAYLLRSPSGVGATVVVQPARHDVTSVSAANDLGVKLATMADARAGSFRVVAAKPGENPRSDLLLEVIARDADTTVSRDLRLLSGRDKAILWGGHFEQPKEMAGDLPPQVGVSAARVLSCALDTRSGEGVRLPAEMTKQYLTACSRLAEEFDQTSTNLSPQFEKVVTEAPRFAPAWDKLLQSEAARVLNEPDSSFAAPLRRHLAQARRSGIDVPSLYLAEAARRPSNDFLGRISDVRRGLERYPSNAVLHATLAGMLMQVGRQSDAIDAALTASELDPLSPAARSTYIFNLAHSGRYDQARQELDKAERLWPGTTTLRWTRFSLYMRYGDPRVALRLVHEGAARGGEAATEAFLEARLNPTKANIDRAVDQAVKVNRQVPIFIAALVQTLATFGRTDDALRLLLNYRHPEYAGFNSEPLFRPPLRNVRRDPRFMRAAAGMGFVAYWIRSGEWPDFCFEPDLPYDCKKEAARYA